MTDAELMAIRKKYKDPAYMKMAIDRVAEKIADELFPPDNEPKLEKPQKTTIKRPEC